MDVSAVLSWLLAAGVVVLGVLGFAFGTWLSLRPGRLWLAGWFVPFALFAAIGLARRIPSLEFVAPFSWLMVGRVEFGISAVSIAMMLAVLRPRLAIARQQTLVVVFALVSVAYTVMPFLLPPYVRAELAALETQVDDASVCWQQTSYNCGPAAAVTALRHLGLPAEEGELAILAHTNPVSGTQCDSLAMAIEERYAADGVECEYRGFDSLEDLRATGLVITVVRYRFLIDHFVTVLAVGDRDVVVADPSHGLRFVSHDDFESVWRRRGLVVRRFAGAVEDP